MPDLFHAYLDAIANNWTVWLVTLFVIVAAVIDGFELRVPNRLTYPFIIAGWLFSGYALGWEGLGYSLLGTLVGFLCLVPFWMIGGMGSGDVKMLAGVGAWMFATTTAWAFAITTIVGAIIAIIQVLLSGQWKKHYTQFWMILREIAIIRDPDKLSEMAAERKPTMRLLPYGIPIAIGTIMYFMWTGMYV